MPEHLLNHLRMDTYRPLAGSIVLADYVGMESDTVATRKLFDAVLRCQNVRFCIEHPSQHHPCHEIVYSQRPKSGELSYETFQLPEPWCGQIDIAPILFVSSNPSIADDQRALGSISDDDAFDSHHYVFGGGRKAHTFDGIYTLSPDGSQSQRHVAYWSSVRARAQELIPHGRVTPGTDYALTEIVRCKSKDEIGVIAAVDECSSRYLDQTMAVAAASVVIGVGKGRELLRSRYSIPAGEMLAEVEIRGKARLVAFLPHPSGFEPGPRTFAGLTPRAVYGVCVRRSLASVPENDALILFVAVSASRLVRI